MGVPVDCVRQRMNAEWNLSSGKFTLFGSVLVHRISMSRMQTHLLIT